MLQQAIIVFNIALAAASEIEAAATAPGVELRRISATPLVEEPERRVPPAPQVEARYRSWVTNGRGWNHKNDHWLSSPFLQYTGSIKKEENSLDMTADKQVITSTKQFNEVMEATASVKASGWGMSMRAEASMDRDISMKSKDAIFLFHGNKELGYEGWHFDQIPGFTQDAMDALCDRGTLTVSKFEEEYGTYYAAGVRKAIALDIWIKVQTKTSSSESKVSGKLSGSWSGFGASASGSASFASEVRDESSFSKTTTKAKAYGFDMNKFPDADMSNVQDIIDDFSEMSGGSGIAHVMFRYDDHPDYKRTIRECGSNIYSLKREKEWMTKLTNLAVEAKLVAEEMLEKSYEMCMMNLAIEGLEIYEGITTMPEEEIGLHTFLEYNLKLNDLMWKWDADQNICKWQCWTKPTFCNFADRSQCSDPNFQAYWNGDSRTTGMCQWNTVYNRCETKTTFCELFSQEQCGADNTRSVWGVPYTKASTACIWAVGSQQANTYLASHAVAH